MDQNGPRVRVRKIVRCPATDSFKYISVWSMRPVEMKDTLAEVEEAERGDHADKTPSTVETPKTRRMFQASGAFL